MNSINDQIQEKSVDKNNTDCNCGCLSNADKIKDEESKNKTINPNN